MAIGKAGINNSVGQFNDALCPAQPGSGFVLSADKNKFSIPYGEDISGRSIGINCVDGRIAEYQIRGLTVSSLAAVGRGIQYQKKKSERQVAHQDHGCSLEIRQSMPSVA